MATLLEEQQVTILGDDEEVSEIVTPDPYSASTERRDTAVLGATGLLPDEVENLPSEVSTRVSNALISDVQEVQEQQVDVEEAAIRLDDQAAKGGELIGLSDYFDNSFHAMENPALTETQNRASIKYQLTAEKIQDAIKSRTAETGAGTVVNWFDRYIFRQFPIGAFEDLTMKRKTVSEEFARAIAGNMSVADYELFLDSKINEYVDQGFFFADNPLALSDLLNTINRFGNDDNAVTEAIIGAIDLFPLATLATSATVKTVKTAAKVNEARKVAKMINTIAKSPTAATRAGAVNGPDAATEVAENIARRTDEPENLANMGPSITDPVGDKAPVRPLGEAALRNQTARDVVNEVYAYANRALGKIYDQAQLGVYISNRINSIQESFNRGVINHSLDYQTNRLTVLLGHPKTGKALTRESAEKFAEDFPEATVVPIDESKGAWAIQVDEAIELDDFIAADKFAQLNHIEGVTGKLFSKIFGNRFTGGSHLRDNEFLTNLAYRAESGAIRTSQLMQGLTSKIGKLSGKELEQVGDIIQRIQSKDLASKRNWFTDDDFIDLWKADNKGKAPSQKVLDGYRATVDLSDTTYILRATGLIRTMHRAGYRRISTFIGGEQVYTAAKKISVNSIDDSARIIDAQSGAVFTKSEYDGPLVNAFEMDMDTNGVKYVVDTELVKPLEPQDVLGYNAGGPRINPEATNFIVLMGKDGIPLKTALSTSSNKTALLAAEQMDTIARAIRSNNLTDDLVAANNKWNPGITTASAMEKFLRDEDLLSLFGNETVSIVSKARDENVFTGVAGETFAPGATLDEFTIFSNRRNDKPLTHFGGIATVNDNPIKGILNQANTESRKIAFSNYTAAAQVSLGKKIKQIADPDSSNKDYRSYYRNIDKWLDKDSSNAVIQKIFERKRITDLRLGAEGFGDRALTRLAQDATEQFYNLTGVKFNVNNPTHLLTNFGFKTTFFGDTFQLLLQSAHSMTIIGATGIDDGISGMVMGRQLLSSLEVEGKQLDIMIDRMAGFYGYSRDEMVEIRELFIDMARYEVDPTNLVEGFQAPSGAAVRLGKSQKARAVSNTVGKAWEKTNNVGMYFFNKGEQITRTTAFGAAVRKWKAQNKGKSILSEEGRTWVSNKEQAYSFNMTNMSRGMIQQGVLRVPTQFMSYLLRSFEAVFVGKNMTARERMGAAVMVGPFWGLTGVGAATTTSGVVDNLNSFLPEDMQIEPGNDMYRLIKNGSVDALFAWAGDVLIGENAPEVSMASRVSLGDGVIDTFRNYREATAIEIIGGAGGGKTGDTLVDFSQFMGSLIRGDEILISTKGMELLRNMKFIDNLSKGYGIWQHQVYSSKTGGEIDPNLNNIDALMAVAGIPLEEVQQIYDAKDIIFRTNKTYRKWSKEVKPYTNQFWRAVNDGNAELANETLESINIMVSRLNGLTPELRQNLKEQVLKGFADTTTFERIQQLRRMGLETEADQLQAITE